MKIVIPGGAPVSTAQRRFDRVVSALLPTFGLLVGCWEARECSRIAFGYVASYSYATAILLAIAALLFALPLLIHWRSRRLGWALIIFGLVSVATFYGAMAVLIDADRVAWRHEAPMQRLGPDQKASVVVYFRRGVSGQQIERFISEVLEEDAMPRHQGRDYPTFVESYLRLSPNQANGFEACAITFRPGSLTRDAKNYLKRIKADPRVAKVFTDAAPTDIESISPDPKY